MAGVSASCVQDNKQTNKQNSKMTTRLKRARRKKLKFRIWCKSVHKQRNGRGFSENAESAWAKSWASCAVIGRNKKLTTRKRTRFSRGIWSSFKCCVFVIGCAWNRLINKETRRAWKHLLPHYHWPLQQPNGKEQFLLPTKVGQLPYGKEQFLSNTTRTLFTFYPKDSAKSFPKVAKSFQFQLWLGVKLPLQGGLWGTEFQDRVVWIGHFMGGNLPLEFLEEVHQLTVLETGVNLPQTPDLSLELIFYI